MATARGLEDGLPRQLLILAPPASLRNDPPTNVERGVLSDYMCSLAQRPPARLAITPAPREGMGFVARISLQSIPFQILQNEP